MAEENIILKALIGRQGVNAVDYLNKLLGHAGESAGYAGSVYLQGHKERIGSLGESYGVNIPGVDEKAIMEGGEQVGTEWDYAKSPERALLLAKGDNIRLQKALDKYNENPALSVQVKEREILQKALDELRLQEMIRYFKERQEMDTPQGPINQEIRISDAELEESSNSPSQFVPDEYGNQIR